LTREGITDGRTTSAGWLAGWYDDAGDVSSRLLVGLACQRRRLLLLLLLLLRFLCCY